MPTSVERHHEKFLKVSSYLLQLFFLISFGYFLSIYQNQPEEHERETFLSEIGEFFGTLGIWALVIIYGRTLLKLAIGTGGIAQRLVPDEYDVSAIPPFKTLLNFLNRTHIFVGIAAIAVILLHIAMVGLHPEILFFPAVLGACGVARRVWVFSSHGDILRRT